MKHVEIERKFLLKDVPWAEISGPGSLIEEYAITQFYHKGFRYRWEGKNCLRPNERYLKMTKVITNIPGVNQEGEIIDITKDEYYEAMSHIKMPIVKKRKVFQSIIPGQKIEVDVFIGMRLVMMEVELPTLEYSIGIPKNIMMNIIAEVTGIKEFSNHSLLKGFSFPGTINL